jgi:hypothetical protein
MENIKELEKQYEEVMAKFFEAEAEMLAMEQKYQEACLLTDVANKVERSIMGEISFLKEKEADPATMGKIEVLKTLSTKLIAEFRPLYEATSEAYALFIQATNKKDLLGKEAYAAMMIFHDAKEEAAKASVA